MDVDGDSDENAIQLRIRPIKVQLLKMVQALADSDLADYNLVGWLLSISLII